jgi:SAM-dependent methyltransferase
VTLGPGYFDRMYAQAADPWGLARRWYERRKYALTLAMLPARRYPDGFEPGCSVGVLTGRLAARCDRLLACDGSPAAAAAAARRNAAHPNVRIEQRSLPGQWPPGRYDLIVLSELLYYFGDADLADVLGRAAAALRPGGTLIAVHWRHPVPEHPRTGDQAHEALRRQRGLAGLAAYADADFLADAFTAGGTPPVSVAAAGGLT